MAYMQYVIYKFQCISNMKVASNRAVNFYVKREDY